MDTIRETWWVRCDLQSPSGSTSRLVSADAVLNFRYSRDSARPWSGVSPLGWAADGGALHGSVQGALRDDMRSATGTVIPMPPGETPENEEDDTLGQLKNALLSARGKSVFVESTASAGGGEYRDAPAQDWVGRRLGPDPPSELRGLLAQTGKDVLSALGVDSVLVGMVSADGQSSRLVYQHFVDLTLAPLARLIETEVRLKLDVPDMTISFRSLRSADYATLARAFRSMKDVGVPVGEIARILDLNLGVE